MVFELIYNQLFEIIGNSFPWLENATAILSFILTTAYILLFVSIPTYLLIIIFNLPSALSNTETKKRNKKSKWN